MRNEEEIGKMLKEVEELIIGLRKSDNLVLKCEWDNNGRVYLGYRRVLKWVLDEKLSLFDLF